MVGLAQRHQRLKDCLAAPLPAQDFQGRPVMPGRLLKGMQVTSLVARSKEI